MSQASNKVKWCLHKAKGELESSLSHRGLVQVKENRDLAEKHLRKAEHNLKAALCFRKEGFSDWSTSAFFYCIYHCLLGIAARFGYESRNQECTIALVEWLIEEKKINLDKRFIDMLTTTNPEEAHITSVIRLRENFQYGVALEMK
ncbi:HEPN domain-containing protein [Candidatus Woesearchaeota archaeon]|nr:HEPN domain-containing protein [Candidatus Woesearchaeota archaeon]